jgi:DNA polymerase II large subunit
MTCPVCKSIDVRRSRRQSLTDYIVGVFGVLPWRCIACETRFYARPLSLSDSLRAHCPICGNMELQRIPGDRVDSYFAFLWSRLSIPAYRCEPCRRKYFSIRPARVKDTKEQVQIKERTKEQDVAEMASSK